MAALFGTIAFVTVPETFTPVLLARKAKRLRHSTHHWAIHAKHEEKGVNLKEIAENFLMRPSRMLFLEPILVLITIYLAFIYGELPARSVPFPDDSELIRLQTKASSTSSSKLSPSPTKGKEAGVQASPASLSSAYSSASCPLAL